RITINPEVLRHNIEVIDGWMTKHGANWTLVTKVLCGHSDTLHVLQKLGVRSMGDSRIDNLQAIERIVPNFESWYLRLPHLSAVPQIVAAADVSLNSEIEIIKAINKEAGRQNKLHRIIVMIELGDLREGILPGSLVGFYKQIFELPHVEVLGIGANIGCLAGAVPNKDQLMQLALYRELLELKFERKLPMISAGSSSVLPLLLEEQVPKAINHFRIGEAVFLGTDLINAGTLPGLRDDAITLEAEIIEIKEKNLVPMGDTSLITPFDNDLTNDENAETNPYRRGYRVIVAIGQLDTDVAGLTPRHPGFRIAGASSDVTVLNIGEDDAGLKIGGTISFGVNYSALLRLMSGKYTEQVIEPPLAKFAEKLKDTEQVKIPPVVETL
ncbi:alanine racemase, partial [bacterium]|nr:alanine racemase [bacterium]